MDTPITRRRFVTSVAAGGLAAASFGLPFPAPARAQAKEALTAVEWGPPYIDETKKQAAKWDKASITWELHQGGAAALTAP